MIEFGAVIDPTMDTIISEDITTVLDVALRQRVLDGTKLFLLMNGHNNNI